MNEPKLPTTHPLVNAVAKQLREAVERDVRADVGALAKDTFGPQAMKVIAEIVSAAAPTMLKLSPEADAILTEALSMNPAALRPGKMEWVPDQTPKGRADYWKGEAMKLADEVQRLNAIINKPERDDFLKGVSIEAEYQREHHGVDATEARFDWHQWYWVVGYLAGKALAACKSGEDNGEKAKHHLITTAALLMNWHNVLTGKPAASVHSNAGKPVADMLVIIPGNGKV